MKLLLLNTNDISDGASIAAYRLLKGLQQSDVQAQMLIQSKENDDYSVIGPETRWQKLFGQFRPAFDSIPIRFYRQRKKIIFSPAILPDNICKKIQDIELVIFGSSKPKDEENLGFKTHYLGQLNDEMSLVLVYSTADVMIIPSIQENLPNTIMESLACGTPVVAFDIIKVIKRYTDLYKDVLKN